MVKVLLIDRHFYNSPKRKIDNVLLEDGGLPHVLPLAFPLKFFAGQVGGTLLNLYYSLTFDVGPFLQIQKLWGGVGWPMRF